MERLVCFQYIPSNYTKTDKFELELWSGDQKRLFRKYASRRAEAMKAITAAVESAVQQQ